MATETKDKDTQTQDPPGTQTEASASTASGRRTPQPEGQTIPSDAGGVDAARGAAPVTTAAPVEDDDEKKLAKAFAKVSGHKVGDIIGLNTRTNVVVTNTGGKYQLNKKGDQLRVLQGPIPPAFRKGDSSARIVDDRSQFVGTAANLNASTHESRVGERANQAVIDADAAQAEAELARERAENARAEAEAGR